MKTCDSRDKQLVAERSLIQDYWLAKPPTRIQTLRDGSLTLGQIYDIVSSLDLQPPVTYRINFVRYIIKQIESQRTIDDEVDERWYEELERLNAVDNQEERFYRIYDVGSDTNDQRIPVTVFEEEKAFVSQGSTGLITWKAAFELSRWLTVDKLATQGLPCSWMFELGCGTGLLSIAVAKKFPHMKKILATDVHEGVLQRCHENLKVNQLNDGVTTLQLDWVKDEHSFHDQFVEAAKVSQGPGLLLGADIFFDKQMAKCLANITRDFLRVSPKGRIYFSSEIRNQDTFAEFKHQIESLQLSFQELHRWNVAESFGSGGVIVEVTTQR